VFYSPLSRAFELLTGAALALYSSKIKIPYWLNHALSAISLIAIFYAGCYLTPIDYPGLNILLPVFGTVLLIVTGENNSIAYTILSIKPLVFIGLISYSLYLWHWPIIAYAIYLGLSLNVSTVLLIFLASLTLATLSWQYIEKPFRFRYTFSFRKTLILFLLLPFLISFTCLALVKYMPNIGFNYSNENEVDIIKNKYFGFINPDSHCHNDQNHPKRLGIIKQCSIGERQADKVSVLITGDSHGMSYVGFLNVLLKHAKLKGYIATQSSTPFLLVNIDKDIKIKKNISKRNPVIKQLIEKNDYKYVILGGDWGAPGYEFIDNINVLRKGLENSIEFIIKNGAKPVIMLDYPPLFNVPVTCGITRVTLAPCYNLKKDILKRQGKIRNMIFTLKNKYPKVLIIDPFSIICDSAKCYSIINNVPLYFTGKLRSHLNYAGSTLLGQYYLRRYEDPFLS